jgi:hypothetical protein
MPKKLIDECDLVLKRVGIQTENLKVYDIFGYLMWFLLKQHPPIQEMKDSLNSMMDGRL